MKRKNVIVIIGLLMIITPFIIYNYIQYKHHTTEKETYSYLLAHGYKDQDILSITSKIKKLSLFTSEVIFSDEPNIAYDYKVKNKTVTQLGPTVDKENYNFKHLE